MWIYSKSIMLGKFFVGDKKVDICKVIDYVMIINNSLEIINMKYSNKLEKLAKKELEQIRTASKNIEELINQIITK